MIFGSTLALAKLYSREGTPTPIRFFPDHDIMNCALCKSDIQAAFSNWLTDAALRQAFKAERPDL